ncbi:coiled-coil domain-containing protein 82 [Candoia aspera]|uniref:coiled-coil domain-containing protein 82 n=1 Tax=Candoia aspera TaxID=51853 RepID=UPI002FD86225
METNSASRRYKTRRSTRAEEPVAKSQVDWRRTKRNQLPESEDEDDEIVSSSEKELESSSEEEVGGKEAASILRKSNGEAVSDADFQTCCSGVASEDLEEADISFRKRKRPRPAVMYDSDESSDSSIVRKVFAKRSCKIDEDNLSVDGNTSPAEEKANAKLGRQIKLQELSHRQSGRSGRVSQCDEDGADDVSKQLGCHSSLTQDEISAMSSSDSMKDFIDDDDDDDDEEEEEEEEEEKEEEELEQENHQPQDRKYPVSSSLLEKHVPGLFHVDRYEHLRRVVKAFLINATDGNFLSSLYAGRRQQRDAQNMLDSLYYLDDRFIQPRLNNLLSSCRWQKRYKDRVNSYPDVRIVPRTAETRSCEACELQRTCKFTVVFSGTLYNSKTLQVDSFMPHDRQVLKIGCICKDRTEVYHKLKHYKYKLYQSCCLAIENKGLQDEPVGDLVDRVFSQLDKEGWMNQQYSVLKDSLDSADFFQVEKMDNE